MNYRISRRADADIEAICQYIAKDNPDAADRLDQRMHEAIQQLARVPGLGHRRADVQDGRYQFWNVGQYVIAYWVEQKELIVVRVIHGARDFRKLFKPKPPGG